LSTVVRLKVEEVLFLGSHKSIKLSVPVPGMDSEEQLESLGPRLS
jgi:hypothetical protein